MLTAAEQQIVREAQELIDDLFPAARFADRIRALGGEDLAVPLHMEFPSRSPAAMKVDIGFRIPRPYTPAGDVFVTAWFFALQRAPDDWEVTEYSMHFGPEPHGRWYFRVCDNPNQPPPRHHFHHQQYPKNNSRFPGGHIPASHASPPLPPTADPGWFVEVLEKFLNENTISIGVIP